MQNYVNFKPENKVNLWQVFGLPQPWKQIQRLQFQQKESTWLQLPNCWFKRRHLTASDGESSKVSFEDPADPTLCTCCNYLLSNFVRIIGDERRTGNDIRWFGEWQVFFRRWRCRRKPWSGESDMLLNIRGSFHKYVWKLSTCFVFD